MTKVKICGIRSVDVALAAYTAGADFLGFNFVPSSRRFIHPEAARKIVEQLPSTVKIVGVFQDEPLEAIKRVIEDLRLDFVQLHGNEPVSYSHPLTQYAGVIKRFSIYDGKPLEAQLDNMKSFDVDYVLLDRRQQGYGDPVQIETARYFARHTPVFLAGGLMPETVAEVVRLVQPFAVDVAGGIEADGDSDAELMARFIEAVKTAMPRKGKKK